MGKRIKRLERKPSKRAPLEIVYVPLSKLKLWEKNPRRNDAAAKKLAKLIKAHGFNSPLVCTPDNIIRKGNTTYKAAKLLGLEEAPVIYLELKDAELYSVADNRAGQFSEWDDGLLAELLGQKSELGLAQQEQLTGISAPEIKGLLEGWEDRGDDSEKRETPDQPNFDVFTKTAVIEAAKAHYRSQPLEQMLRIEVPAHSGMQAINRMSQLSNEELAMTNACYTVSSGFHPHRKLVPVTGTKTAQNIVDDDAAFTRFLSWMLESSGGLGPKLPSAINIAQGAQIASNFRPGYACLIYRTFGKKKGRVLDCSMGFGGRIVGFLASKLGGKYVGIDPSTKTFNGNKRMVEAYGVEDMFHLIHKPAEDVRLKEGRFDLAFTSPPYFSKERYSNEPTQSWKRYTTGKAWREGFLRPMIKMQYHALRSGAHSIINISEVNIKGKRFDLPAWTREIAKKVGFRLERTMRYEFRYMPGKGDRSRTKRWEPVLVFVKP